MTTNNTTPNNTNEEATPETKTWKIPVVWQSWGVMEIEAASFEEAVEKALGDEPLPTDYTYVDDSCQVDNEQVDENQNE